jgi:nucleoside-diphosphate-sugar epimerase
MRVFVTGAAGFVGSAVTAELIAHGHSVIGLARSEANIAALTKAGAEIHQGSLEDEVSLRAGAAKADGVIHCAFNHDFSKWAENGQLDKRAIEAMGGELKGSDRPLIVSSGVALLTPGRVSTEDDRNENVNMPRVSEQAVFGLDGVKGMAIRLPPTVHGAGDKGFVPQLINTARQRGEAAYVGEGQNRWPATHRFDAAKVYRLALEKGRSGRAYHAIAEEGIAFRDIAGAIGQGLNLPVVSKTPDQASAYFGFFALFASTDVPSSSAITRRELGWSPTEPGLIADMSAHYFK